MDSRTIENNADLPDFDTLWDYRNPSETEKAFLRVQSEYAATADIAYQAELLTQIARTQGLQRKFDTAHETARQRVLVLVDGGGLGRPLRDQIVTQEEHNHYRNLVQICGQLCADPLARGGLILCRISGLSGCRHLVDPGPIVTQ